MWECEAGLQLGKTSFLMYHFALAISALYHLAQFLAQFDDTIHKPNAAV
ncbi:MAG: hypothetical protein N6V49_01065 [Serratia symbiotica]|nr:hypothetical protein [Serratia symbiotica]